MGKCRYGNKIGRERKCVRMRANIVSSPGERSPMKSSDNDFRFEFPYLQCDSSSEGLERLEVERKFGRGEILPIFFYFVVVVSIIITSQNHLIAH